MKNSQNFKKNGYCLVKSAISSELRDFITQYALFDEMQRFDGVGDGQTPEAYFRYADPAMESLLLTLQKIMEENTGLTLFPTYSYYRVYRPGQDLKKHTDRPSCEISATLCFNYDYDGHDYAWPIYMDGNRVVLEPGDMVIYRGCDLEHWRDIFGLNSDRAWHVQGFFHYVNANGPYAEWQNDKRSTIGSINKPVRELPGSNKPYITYL